MAYKLPRKNGVFSELSTSTSLVSKSGRVTFVSVHVLDPKFYHSFAVSRAYGLVLVQVKLSLNQVAGFRSLLE